MPKRVCDEPSKRSWLGIVSVFVGVGAVSIYWFGPLRGVSDPAIEYPESLDLGSRERGSIVVSRFAITNRGGGELVINH